MTRISARGLNLLLLSNQTIIYYNIYTALKMFLISVILVVLTYQGNAEISIMNRNNPGIIFSRTKNVMFVENEWTLITAWGTNRLSENLYSLLEASRNIKNSSTYNKLMDAAIIAEMFIFEQKIHQLGEIGFEIEETMSSYSSEDEKSSEEGRQIVGNQEIQEDLAKLNEIRNEGNEAELLQEKRVAYVSNELTENWEKSGRKIQKLNGQIELLMLEKVDDVTLSNIEEIMKISMEIIDGELENSKKALEFLKIQNMIISNKMLKSTIDSIKNISKGEFPANTSRLNPVTVKKLTRTELYATEGHIVIRLHLELVHKGVYRLYEIASIPVFQDNQHAALIEVGARYIAVRENSSTFVELNDLSNCFEAPTIYTCRIDAAVQEQLNCAAELLFKPSYTTFHKCKIGYERRNEGVFIKRTVNPAQWIFSVANNQQVKGYCPEKYETLTLRRSGILTIPSGCRVQWGNNTYYGAGPAKGNNKEFYLPPLQLMVVTSVTITKENDFSPISASATFPIIMSTLIGLGAVLVLLIVQLAICILCKRRRQSTGSDSFQRSGDPEYVPMRTITLREQARQISGNYTTSSRTFIPVRIARDCYPTTLEEMMIKPCELRFGGPHYASPRPHYATPRRIVPEVEETTTTQDEVIAP